MGTAIKCHNLVEWLEWVILLCEARDRPYVPDLGELNKFCKNGNHAKCPIMRHSNGFGINSERVDQREGKRRIVLSRENTRPSLTV